MYLLSGFNLLSEIILRGEDWAEFIIGRHNVNILFYANEITLMAVFKGKQK